MSQSSRPVLDRHISIIGIVFLVSSDEKNFTHFFFLGTYDAGDSTNTDTSSEHVLEMFLKRLRHHASKLHMFLEDIKIGKFGLATLLLGSQDASYDEFDFRKVIVAFTKHGSLYGLDR